MNLNDIGLKVLRWVKKIIGQSVDLKSLERQNTTVIEHQIWSGLVAQHVQASGKVDYNGFRKDNERLSEYLELLSNNPPGKNWSQTEQLAYWINAYNAFTVKLILDHYPLKSIRDIGRGLPMVNSPWDIKFFAIGNVSFDLNTIEHEILRKRFNEPRIHFAINCASVSCPKLRNEAFTAEKLIDQLEDQARQFINNPEKNVIESARIKVSKIFDWFKSDFTKTQSLMTYLQEYTEMDLSGNTTKVDYMDYNWNLNE